MSQLAMVHHDFAQYWNEICSLPIELITDMVKHAQQQGFCADDDPHLVAVALLSMLNQFCYTQLAGGKARSVDAGRGGGKDPVDDDACITTLANIFYRAIYHKGTA